MARENDPAAHGQAERLASGLRRGYLLTTALACAVLGAAPPGAVTHS
jgi:hypothetical protein